MVHVTERGVVSKARYVGQAYTIAASPIKYVYGFVVLCFMLLLFYQILSIHAIYTYP